MFQSVRDPASCHLGYLPLIAVLFFAYFLGVVVLYRNPSCTSLIHICQALVYIIVKDSMAIAVSAFGKLTV